MLVATALPMLVIVPGLVLFYGGLVRAKNIRSVLMQVLVVAALALVLWVAYGYSLAFEGGNGVLGGLGKVLLAGIGPDSAGDSFTPGVLTGRAFSFAGIAALIARLVRARGSTLGQSDSMAFVPFFPGTPQNLTPVWPTPV